MVINASPDEGESNLRPAIPLEEARRLVDEGDASYATAKATLLPVLIKPLQHQRRYPHLGWMRTALQAHEAAGARRWQDRLLQPSPAVPPSVVKTEVPFMKCAHCGTSGMELKQCAACRSIW